MNSNRKESVFIPVLVITTPTSTPPTPNPIYPNRSSHHSPPQSCCYNHHLSFQKSSLFVENALGNPK